MKLLLIFALFFSACTLTKRLSLPVRSTSAMSGSEFYKKAIAMQWQQRDSFALQEILAGNLPGFWKKFTAIQTSITDSASGKKIRAIYFVSRDYLSIGNDHDWARVPLTPMAGQKIADMFQCFLPTRKIVDDIYRQAKIHLEPVPLLAFRDSTVTMWQHHLIIEGQRRGRKGLIAGIKKDVVISGKISRDPKPGRVAIYGWHQPGGRPIQPLYTGHVNWYVDYSHGIRLVYRKMKVGRKWMDYTAVLQDPTLKALICDEADCDFYRYPE